MRKFLSCVSVLSIAGVLMVTANAGAEAIVPESYVYDGTGDGATPLDSIDDTDMKELLDGILPDGTQPIGTLFGDDAWVGFTASGATTPQPQVTFALGRFWDLGTIDMTFLSYAPWSIGIPESVLISVSGDNVTFSDPVEFTGYADNSTSGLRTIPLDVLALDDAKYVRLDFRNSSIRTLVAEISFNGFRSASTTWDGGKGDWADAKWRGGKNAIEHDSVAINAESGDSDVTLNDVWYASSVSVGLYHPAKFTVGEGGGYLIVDESVSVGADGVLQVDANGVLAANSLQTSGTTVIDADLEDILTVQVTGGSTSLAGGSVVNLDIADGTVSASRHLMVLQDMKVRGGTASMTGGNVSNLHVTSGSLTTSADLTVSTMAVDNGAFGTTGGSLKILNSARLLDTTFAAGDDRPMLKLSGADLLNGRRLMSIGDGTVTVSGNVAVSNTDVAVSGNTILTLDTTDDVTLRDMTLDGSTDTTLTVSAGPGKITIGGLTGRGDLLRDGGVGEFLVEGTLAPGNSTGRLGIGGSITIEDLLEIELGGTGEGQFDQLDVSGQATITGATLVVDVLPSYTPSAGGDTFVILTADQGVVGQFTPPTLPDNMSIAYDANNVMLHVAAVPEPSTLLLMATAALLGLVGLARRKKTLA